MNKGKNTIKNAKITTDENAIIGDHNTIIKNEIIQYADKKIRKILGNPPFFPEVFLGREEDLKTVHQHLFHKDEETLLLLVNGRGGIGKTTLAAKYYLRYHDHYTHLAWVFAESSILDALLTLAIPLQVDFPPRMPNEERLSHLLASMRDLEKPCLLVIDNANQLADLQKYYGALRSCPNFHLLLTTRITEFEQAPIHHIEPLEKKAAFALFKKYYLKHQKTADGLLTEIMIAVGYNTLVIELLAKNLRNFNRLKTRYTLQDLLDDLQTKGLLALRQSKTVRTAYQAEDFSLREAKPEEIIAAMYDLSDLSDAERILLAYFAVLPAENIPFETLEALLSNSETLEEPLLELAQKGWLEYNEDNATFKMSPVVQEIIKNKNSQLLVDCKALIDGLIEKLKYQPGVGHLLNATYEEGAIYARYGEGVVDCFEQGNTDLGILCERFGRFYQTTGNLEQALFFFEKYAFFEKELHDNDPQNTVFKNGLAISYCMLGNTHGSLGDIEKTLGYYEKYNELGKELHDNDPQNTEFRNNLAISYSKLGETYSSLGDLEKALGYYEKDAELSKELYESHPTNVGFKNGLAISYLKLGNTYRALGDLEKALGYYEKSAELSKELYESHPTNVGFKNGLAISYSKLGETYSALGDLEKALNYYEKYFELQKALYESHPTNVGFKNGLAISYEKLGNTYRGLGDLEKALGYYEKYFELQKALYDSYPTNVGFKNGLAVSYIKLGLVGQEKQDVAMAKKWYQKAELLWSELVERFPKYVEFKKNLDWVQEKLERE